MAAVRTKLAPLLGTHPAGTEGHAVVAEILTGHPVWAGRALDAVRVRRSPLNGSLQLQVRPPAARRWTTISWRQCAAPGPRARHSPSPRARLRAALRTAVWRHAAAWKRRQHGQRRCAACGAAAGLEADHAAPPFDSIMAAFLAAEDAGGRAPPTRFGYAAKTCAPKLLDAALARRWQRFHAERARYQFLCRGCNASKGKGAAPRANRPQIKSKVCRDPEAAREPENGPESPP